jgi:NADPH:quinone reductase
MRGIRQHRYGGPDVLVLDELADLEPGPGQVRISVLAAGVHVLDLSMREGRTDGPFPPRPLPLVPGREVAGVVDRLGKGVADRWLGLSVVAHLGMAHGGYAEQALAPVDALVELAPSTPATNAVAMVGTGRTALGILAEAAITPDDLVLVPAAAGGLGTLLVQAAKAAGATVIGAAGGVAKVELVASLGADLAVDYSSDDWDDEVRSFVGDRSVSLVLDGVGGEVGRRSFELVGPGGRIVLFGYTGGTPTRIESVDLFERGLAASAAIGPRMFARPGGIQALAVEAIAELESGRLAPVVHPPFPLADAGQAHHAMAERQTTGKVVLVP